MGKRYVPSKKNGGGVYYPFSKTVSFIHTGCTVLDCVLGGGWAGGRIINIVGDKAVGKTLLAIEACANFAMQNSKGYIWYREGEAAFDPNYAETLGLPIKRVDFGPDDIETVWGTVEDIFEDLDKCIEKAAKDGQPGLYIVDSLDALSSREELERAIDKGSYKTEKAKVLSELFRRLSRRIKAANICVIFISQVRDKIGITFGDKKSRSGGKAMDFYASQILYLSHLKNLTRTVHGNKRVVAVRVKAKCKKNKVGIPFRECEFALRFGFGVDDAKACVEWLAEAGRMSGAQAEKQLETLEKLQAKDYPAFEEALAKLQATVLAAWEKVEGDFVPPHRKYSNKGVHA